MSTSQIGLRRTLPFLSTGMGILALGGGILSIVNPQAFSEGVGIHVPTSSSAALPLASLAGSRNLGLGITVLALLYIGQRKAVGMTFMCGVVTAMRDSWICFQHDGTEGKAVGHAVMGVACGLLGAGMYWV